MKKLKLTLFRDGRPGHEKQSLGIIEALRYYVDIEVSDLEIKSPSPTTQVVSLLSYLLHLDTCSYELNDTDLIIGTGSKTHIPILSAARKYHAKAVTCMTPMGYLINRFDLCCVPLHDKVKDTDNIFRTVGPPNIATSSGRHDSNRGLILIGGVDEGSHVWNNKRLIGDISTLIAEDRQWTISTSPRTPEDTETLINELIGQRDNVTFLPFSATPSGWVEEQYQRNESVWITGDSISMVYEALSAGCSVGILPVQWKKSDNKFKRSLDYLAERDLIILLEEFHPGHTRISSHEPLNEADRCAKEILQRWWPTSLP